jgi:hypothetical protein
MDSWFILIADRLQTDWLYTLSMYSGYRIDQSPLLSRKLIPYVQPRWTTSYIYR